MNLEPGLHLFRTCSLTTWPTQRDAVGECRALAAGPVADVHADGPRREADERRDAVPGPPLERADLRATSRALRLRRPARAADPGVVSRCGGRRGRARPATRSRPDICIMNYYTEASRMGVHQDKDERPRDTRGRGADRVGVARRHARFVIGGLTRREPTQPADAALGRRAGDGRAVTPALPRRDAAAARHRAGGHRVRAVSI